MKPELLKHFFGCAGLVLIVLSVNGCSRSVPTAEQTKDRVETRDGVQVHQIPAGKEFAGFLKRLFEIAPKYQSRRKRARLCQHGCSEEPAQVHSRYCRTGANLCCEQC